MNVTIHPSSISGTVVAPPSKSAMQRACALALLHNGETIISNPGNSNDDLAALEIIKKLGATVTSLDNNKLSIIGVTKVSPIGNLDCGESGLSLRMFTPIAALTSNEIKITGSGSLLSRPVDLFENV